MERRVLTVVVSIVVAALVFLGVYNYIGDDNEVAAKVGLDRSSANASAGTDEFVSLSGTEADKPTVAVEVSRVGGSLRSYRLLDEQYRQVDRSDSEKTYIPDSRLAAGPYEVVGPWSPAFYPFQLEFTQLGWESRGPETTRLVRAKTTGQWLADGTGVGLPDKQAEDLEIRPGDVVVGAGIAAVISKVGSEGMLFLREAVPTRPSEVTVIRKGKLLDQYHADATFSVLPGATDSSVTMVWPNPRRDTSSAYIVRRWEIVGGYELQHEVSFVNLADSSLRAKYSVVANGWVDPYAEPPGMFSPPVQDWSPTCFVNGAHEQETLADILDEGGEVSYPGAVQWFGVNSQFFLLAAAFEREEGIQGTCRLRAAPNGVISAVFGRGTEDVIPGASHVCVPDWLSGDAVMSCVQAMKNFGVDQEHLDEASLDRALDTFDGSKEDGRQYKVMLSAYRESRDQGRLKFRVFGGPKDLRLLEGITPTLDNTLDFWFVGFLAKPMLAFLKFLYELVGVWWIAILLLTVVIRMGMLPLTQKSYVQMQKMKELKPEIDALQKKYGNDKQRLQTEMMGVYKRHNMNPMGGCFPMLLQMPLYFALYRCLYAAVDLYQAPLVGWIADMTQPDPYYVLPVLLGIFMFVQQQFMPSTGGDEMQQKIIKYVMPVMFSVFMFMLPSGLVFYIMVSTVISVGQQWWIKRQFGAPAPVGGGK